MKIATGQRITCKHPTEAYYSNYGITPELIFSPGMVAVVKTISPKVCLPSKNMPLPDGIDRKQDFIVADYTDENGDKRRVGLNFCNVVVL